MPVVVTTVITSPFTGRQVEVPEGAEIASGTYATSTTHQGVETTTVESYISVASAKEMHHKVSVQNSDPVHKMKSKHGISKKLEFWKSELSDHPDKKFANKIIEYIEFGAPIGIDRNMTPVTSPNWPSAEKFRDHVSKFIEDRIEDGSIEQITDTSGITFSPISAFMKKSGKKVNVVHDLSFPPDKSTNDHISKEYSSVKYTTVIDAVKICTQLEDPWLAKTDLKNAYFSLPIQYQDSKFMGFKWSEKGNERSYMWRSAPYGLRSAARLFTDTATALRYMYVKKWCKQKLRLLYR